MPDRRKRPYSRGDLARSLAGRSLSEFADDHCAQFASSIAYHVLFSLFPLAIVLAAVLGIVVRTAGVRADVVDAIAGALPLTPSGTSNVRELLHGATDSLSTLGLLGIVGLLFSASGMMAAIRTAINIAFDVHDTRPFLKGKLIDLGLVALAGLAATVSIGLTIVARVVAGTRQSLASVDLGASWVQWVAAVAIPLSLSFVVVTALYRFIPAVPVRFRHAAPAGLGVAVLFVLMQNLFALYLRNFGHYNAIYGSLGAIVAFMFFVYLGALLFLLGAEATSEWPRAIEDLEAGDAEPGPPASVQVRSFLRGLWKNER